MKESEVTTNLVKSLRRFFNGDEEIFSAISDFLSNNPDATKAQLFQSLANDKGTGKSHHQRREGVQNPNHWNSPRKYRRRW